MASLLKALSRPAFQFSRVSNGLSVQGYGAKQYNPNSIVRLVIIHLFFFFFFYSLQLVAFLL